ncbi:hypothetical protein PsorP6_012218 [Peronosclerospora sorghi]|uniref:Uncharacterized protein n=1 Tax=Peronosclerospora sorghi TaxID=230839 RepID=A0ACC0WIG4_9STRA|nr:hypothetical protein PsorP6_012218 [Peronosclerospora sorghi]
MLHVAHRKIKKKFFPAEDGTCHISKLPFQTNLPTKLSLVEDDDELLDDLSEAYHLSLCNRYVQDRTATPKRHDYVLNFLFSQTETMFKQHVRTTQNGFRNLVALREPHPIFHNNNRSPQVNVAYQTAVCLMRLAHVASLSSFSLPLSRFSSSHFSFYHWSLLSSASRIAKAFSCAASDNAVAKFWRDCMLAFCRDGGALVLSFVVPPGGAFLFGQALLRVPVGETTRAERHRRHLVEGYSELPLPDRDPVDILMDLLLSLEMDRTCKMKSKMKRENLDSA